MFTGIIESTGIISAIQKEGSNFHFTIKSSVSDNLKIDQSVSHNGVCLTVVAKDKNEHRVTAISETMEKTNLAFWKTGSIINLERAMLLNGRLDGHFVQGHVDGTGLCISKKEAAGSWIFSFRFHEKFAPLVIEKGSVCINGVSLTVFNVSRDKFSVAVIPFTFENTQFQHLSTGEIVNLEFDVLGKYFLRYQQLKDGTL